jgi:methyl-accepting chemotaxis protein
MEVGQAQAETSVGKATSAGQALDGLTANIGAISDMNTQIAAAAEEQSTVSEEINRNISNIYQASEQNAQAMSQLSTASKDLAVMAESMKDQVAFFKIASAATGLKQDDQPRAAAGFQEALEPAT